MTTISAYTERETQKMATSKLKDKNNMKDVEVNISFMETCIKCDKSMRSEDGKTVGGMMKSISLDGATIYATTCWECVFSEEI
jgi:predicted nucleic-acid-binding Zn-ribbon protein